PNGAAPSSAASSGSGTQQAAITLEEAVHKSNAMRCKAIFGCCDAEAQTKLSFGAKDEQGCEANFAKAYEMYLKPDLTEWQKAGRFASDGIAAVECFAAWQPTTCDEASIKRTVLSECGKAFVGHVENGGGCPIENACKDPHSRCIENKCQPPL